MAFDYTPTSINDIVFPDNDTQNLIYDLINNNVPYPNAGKNGILLYGNWGTGKSTLSRFLPELLEKGRGYTGYVYTRREVIIPPNNGVPFIENLQNTIEHVTFGSHYWHVILDEVDQLTPQSMTTLKGVMDVPSALWVLITNNINKIDQGVKDRCHLVCFNAAPADRWLPLARRIMSDYGVAPVDDDSLTKVISTGNGSARNIISSLCMFANMIRVKRGMPKI